MASEHKYKLIYFNLRGRAEPVRMMMALAGQEYEEENPDQKDWPVIKGSKSRLGNEVITGRDDCCVMTCYFSQAHR